jgi:hypothetical protein
MVDMRAVLSPYEERALKKKPPEKFAKTTLA